MALRRKPAEKAQWRRENKRERLEGFDHIWVEDVDEQGRPCWTLTVTTPSHTYVRASSAAPYQWGDEKTLVQVTRPVREFLADQA